MINVQINTEINFKLVLNTWKNLRVYKHTKIILTHENMHVKLH